MPKPLHASSYAPPDERTQRRIIALYLDSGLNIRQIAKRYSGIVSEDAISRILHEADVTIERARSGAV